VWVENKAEVLEAARRARLPVATWFGRLPVHVAPASAASYGYAEGQCPRAERLFEREIHLPTGPEVSVERAGAAAALVKRLARFTLP
jgi:dTDP-4-amino-4,6-dideoxygalactose transaminase